MNLSKSQIRQQKRDERTALSLPAVEQLSAIIQDKILRSPFWPKTGRVALYSPIKNEVMTQNIFQNAIESGLHVYFPRVEQGINFYEVNGPEDLQKGSWGILEPNMECQPLALEDQIDLFLVPGVAFSKNCYRIGNGRGFYDKFFSDNDVTGKMLGMAYDFQMVETFEADKWDIPIHAVMTEKKMYTRG